MWNLDKSEWKKVQPSKEQLAKVELDLIHKPIPVYFNFAGIREDLLNKAIDSVPKDICEVRVQRWDYPSPPFSKALNKIISECKSKEFIFMHYDAEILSKNIILEIVEEYKSRRRAKLMLPHAKRSSFISTLDTSMDCLTLYDVEVIKSLGCFDESFEDSYMESDLIQKCHLLGIPHPHLYPYALGWRNDISGKFIHHEGILRDDSYEENVKARYAVSFPKDFERFWGKWGINHWCGIHEMHQGFLNAHQGYIKELEYSKTHGLTKDVMKNFDITNYIKMRKELVSYYNESIKENK